MGILYWDDSEQKRAAVIVMNMLSKLATIVVGDVRGTVASTVAVTGRRKHEVYEWRLGPSVFLS